MPSKTLEARIASFVPVKDKTKPSHATLKVKGVSKPYFMATPSDLSQFIGEKVKIWVGGAPGDHPPVYENIWINEMYGVREIGYIEFHGGKGSVFAYPLKAFTATEAEKDEASKRYKARLAKT